MIKELLKYILILSITGTVGIASGYAAAPLMETYLGVSVYPGYSSVREFLPMQQQPLADDNTRVTSGEPLAAGDISAAANQFISAGDAVIKVKEAYQAEGLMGVEPENRSINFYVFQKPEPDQPVWVIKARQTGKDEVPATRLVKVDALSGKILNITEADLELAGVHIGDKLSTVQDLLGKPLRVKMAYDGENKQTVRTLEYDGLQVVVGSKIGVSEIIAASADYPTIRGLKIRDAKEKLLQLYGDPDVMAENVMAYNRVGTDKKVFFVKVLGERVTLMSIENLPSE